MQQVPLHSPREREIMAASTSSQQVDAFDPKWAQVHQTRLTALHESHVCRVSGWDDQQEIFYCTVCNVHISHVEAAETQVESNYHQANLRANPDPLQGGASYSSKTEEGLPAFQGFQRVKHPSTYATHVPSST